nr:MAG TPA: hypothetical protein [Caudoviricetes sp.]
MRGKKRDPHTYCFADRSVSRVVRRRLADTAGRADGIRKCDKVGVQHTRKHVLFAGGI